MNVLFRVALLIGLLFISPTAYLELRLLSYSSTTGQLIVSVFENSRLFLSEPLQTIIITPIPEEEALVEFENLPIGEVAIAAFHDTNANGELDTGLFGIPTEDFVFSNNARGTFGPPTFESAAITLTEGQNLHTISF